MPPPHVHVLYGSSAAMKNNLVTTSCHRGPRATMLMPISERGRGKRWALLTPFSSTLHQWCVFFSQNSIQCDVMKQPECSLYNIFVLTFTGESPQMCRNWSFPGYIPKCSYAISLRISPHCPVQKFYYFLEEKKKNMHMKIITRKSLILIKSKQCQTNVNSTFQNPMRHCFSAVCGNLSSCSIIKSHAFQDVK